MVMVDCDLYASARLALGFVRDILAEGCIVALDDRYCYRASPDRGDLRAFREFLAGSPGIEAMPFQDFGWHGKSFVMRRRP